MTDDSLYRALTTQTRDSSADLLSTRSGDTVSCATFHHRGDAMADALRNRDLERGDRIIVQVDKSVDSLVLYMAALRIGAVYVPLNPAYTDAEVAHYVENADPRLYVGDHGVSAPATTLGDLTAEASAADGSGPDTSAVGSDVATMLYTSGTTGNPKGAPATAAGLIRNGRDLAERWQFTQNDVLLHVLPLFHVHGLFVAMHCALLTGGRVLFHDRFDAATAIDALRSSTVMMGVPTMYTRMLAHESLNESAAAGMRLFTSGSAPLTALAHDEFARRTGHRIVERYGLTETGILTSNRIGGEEAGTVGHGLPGVELRVADATQVSASPGSPGEVQVRGVTVTDGYWRAPEATGAAVTSDGWFRTGDIATMDSSGRVTLLGREKDIVISGGENIYPAELETAILEKSIAPEVAIIGVPHPDFGEVVVAVTPQPVDAHSVDLTDIAAFKRPKKWVTVEELPRNAMGKVQKQVLRERFEGLFG